MTTHSESRGYKVGGWIPWSCKMKREVIYYYYRGFAKNKGNQTSRFNIEPSHYEPDFLRAIATKIANINCCCIHNKTRIAMHLPCSWLRSIDTIVVSDWRRLNDCD